MTYFVEWLDYCNNPHSKPFESLNDARKYAQNRSFIGDKEVNVFEEENYNTLR